MGNIYIIEETSEDWPMLIRLHEIVQEGQYVVDRWTWKNTGAVYTERTHLFTTEPLVPVPEFHWMLATMAGAWDGWPGRNDMYRKDDDRWL